MLNGGAGADEFVRNYRLRIVPTTSAPFYEQRYELLEGESLIDYNASLGDRITKRIVAITA
ncbi:MAG: hypothetical protein WD738_12030 [Pirellulales bacterium]